MNTPQNPSVQNQHIRSVTIPVYPKQSGLLKVVVSLLWHCPVCGEPRGDVFKTHSNDGGLMFDCDGWKNPCGHIDLYDDVKLEAESNGLNEIGAHPADNAQQRENEFQSNPHRQHLPELERRYRAVKGSFEMLTVFESPNAKSAAAMVEDAELLLEAAKTLQASFLAMEGGQ